MAKAAASSAAHHHRERNLNEFAGAYGESLTYEELKWLASWLLIRGCNLLVPHAYYYSMRGPRPWQSDLEPLNVVILFRRGQLQSHDGNAQQDEKKNPGQRGRFLEEHDPRDRSAIEEKGSLRKRGRSLVLTIVSEKRGRKGGLSIDNLKFYRKRTPCRDSRELNTRVRSTM